MGLSNIIEEFIRELLEESNTGIIEIQRNEMAEHFECAPSQINYVLSTRFTPYKGYYIESKRGGGGYIRLVKVKIEKYSDLNEIIIDTIGESITKSKAFHIVEGLREEEFISEREEEIIKAALSDRAISGGLNSTNEIRAKILRNILLILAK